LTFVFKPGEDNRPAGTYREVGPHGGEVNDPRIIQITFGERLPPTQESGNQWRIIIRE